MKKNNLYLFILLSVFLFDIKSENIIAVNKKEEVFKLKNLNITEDNNLLKKLINKISIKGTEEKLFELKTGLEKRSDNKFAFLLYQNISNKFYNFLEFLKEVGSEEPAENIDGML